MARVEIFRKRSMDADIGSKWRYVEPPSLSFEARLELDGKAADEIGKDSVLLKDMNGAATEVYQQTCEGIRKKLAAFDKAIGEMLDNGASKAEVEKQLDGLNKSIEKDRDVAEKAAEQAILKAWKDYTAKKKDYLAYKINVVTSVAGSLAALITSISLMATSPFTGGASAAISIVGMFKSAAQIGRELATAWAEVETALKVLAKEADTCEKWASSAIKRKANEYGAALLEQFLGVTQPSLKLCKKHLDIVQSKLNGIEIKTHEASKALNGVLDQQDVLRKEFMGVVEDRLGKHPASGAKAQIRVIEGFLDNHLKDSKADVVKHIGTVEDLYKRFKDVDAELGERRKQVETLLAKRDLDERVLRLVLSFADVPLAFVPSGAGATAKGAAELANDMAPWAASMVYDKLRDKVLKDTLLA